MIETNKDFFPKPSAETRGAVEFFGIVGFEVVRNESHIAEICAEALNAKDVPSYLFDCLAVFQKGVSIPCKKAKWGLKRFLRDCLTCYTKQHKAAVLYSGVMAVRDVEACAVWVWLINAIISVL